MRLTQLAHFVAIVDAGSIRGAARAQRVSHPAITKSLRLLEDELGVQLLRRSPRGVGCTAAGNALLARARAIGAELRKAEEEVAAIASPGAGHVSVGLSPIAASIAPAAVAQFIDAHPRVRLRLVEGPPSVLVPMVRDETLDVAFLLKMATTMAPGLKFRLLYRDRMTIAARRDHPLRNARTLAELCDATWLAFNAPGTGAGSSACSPSRVFDFRAATCCASLSCSRSS